MKANAKTFITNMAAFDKLMMCVFVEHLSYNSLLSYTCVNIV